MNSKTSSFTRRLALSAVGAAAALTLAGPAMAQANKTIVGVAIPSATHGFTGGIVYWANQAKKDLEKAHPGLQVIVKTAGGAP
ncbi:MAG: ABC transporter substrate-binding protein, partial [Gammaproteobacteria bacterium]|nr:ABC transporter substrate-binding protein [Gammaproteobacteria bacterium]